MGEEMPYVLSFYVKKVSEMISEKYAIEPMSSLRKFLFSKTYQMLVNPELEMWDFSPLGIFDMWESEQITGSPLNSLYLRRD
jgi:hypothetical protein